MPNASSSLTDYHPKDTTGPSLPDRDGWRRSARLAAAAAAFVLAGGLGACGVFGPTTVEDADVMLDCYFLPIDRGVTEGCKPGKINSVSILAGTFKSSLAEAVDAKSTEYSPVFADKLKTWEKVRTVFAAVPQNDESAEARESHLYDLRLLRGLYIYAYLSRLAHDVTMTDATDARTTAGRIVSPLRRGLSNLQAISEAKKRKDSATAGFGHTYKVDAFFDGFEATFEARLATAGRIANWLQSWISLVDVKGVRDRVQEGAKFAYGEMKNRTFASALQHDLVEKAIAITKGSDGSKDLVLDATRYSNAVSAAVKYINKYCGALARAADLPESDQTCIDPAVMIRGGGESNVSTSAATSG